MSEPNVIFLGPTLSGAWYSSDQANNALDTTCPFKRSLRFGETTVVDSPYTADLAMYKAVYRKDSMQMWLMFMPACGGKWVPLRRVDWTWHGMASLDSAGVWHAYDTYNSPNPITDSESFVHPEWVENVTSYFHQHKM